MLIVQDPEAPADGGETSKASLQENKSIDPWHTPKPK